MCRKVKKANKYNDLRRWICGKPRPQARLRGILCRDTMEHAANSGGQPKGKQK
jgi:hypothetical protein